MRTLTRYFLRAHVGPFLFALTVLTALLLINTVARRFEELAGKGLPASVIAEVFVLSVPHIIALTLPMAVLVAILYTFSQFAADNEITALKANGINLTRLLLPLVAAGSVLTGGMLYFNDSILPESNHRLRALLVDIGRKSPTLELKEQVVNEIATGDNRTRYFLRAGRIEPATNRLWDIVIYDLSDQSRGRTIYADSGRMAFNRDRTDLFLTLHNGWVYEVLPREPDRFRRLFFDQQRIRVAGVGNQLERGGNEQYRGDREMSLSQLAEAVDTRRVELADVHDEAAVHARDAARQALDGPPLPEGDSAAAGGAIAPRPGTAGWPDDLTSRTARELRTLEGRADVLERRINQFRVEYHKKYSIPFACIVFVLLGVPLAIRFPRGGVGMVIATSLTIFSVYYMALMGGEELADSGIVAPAVAMWAPNVIFFGLALWSITLIGRETSTARGGGDGLGRMVRRLATRPLNALRRGSEA